VLVINFLLAKLWAAGGDEQIDLDVDRSGKGMQHGAVSEVCQSWTERLNFECRLNADEGVFTLCGRASQHLTRISTFEVCIAEIVLTLRSLSVVIQFRHGNLQMHERHDATWVMTGAANRNPGVRGGDVYQGERF
jgi:hypothetical protein